MNLISPDIPGALPNREASTSAAPDLSRKTTPRSASVEPVPDPAIAQRDEERRAAVIERLRMRFDVTTQSRLLIDHDEDSARFIYSVLDPDTGETMRQWPSESYLKWVAYLKAAHGALVDESA